MTDVADPVMVTRNLHGGQKGQPVRRFAVALIGGVVLALTTGLPAWAQPYGGGGGGTTTTTTTEPGGGEPEQPRVEASVSDADVTPGQTVTVTVPPVFAPGSPIVVNLARAQSGADADVLAQGTAGATGAVNESVTIPDTESGVYFLYVTGVDSDGNEVVAVTAIVIRNDAPAASVQGDTAAAPVPASVADLQTVAPETEAAVVDAVTDGAGVVLSPQGTLQVRSAAGALQAADSLPRTGADDISQQVTIGAALVLAGTGLVLLRRRRGGFTS